MKPCARAGGTPTWRREHGLPVTPPSVDAIEFAHALHVDQIVRGLAVDVGTGLTSAEVDDRLRRFGRNVLPRVRERSALRILIEQFRNIVVVLLAAASAISWATGDPLDAVAILAVLVLNGAIGFAMEWQAGRALEALRRETRIITRVRRNGQTVSVPAEELVAGDVVLLQAGDRVPADLRIVEAAGLRVEEAPLTGESKSVFKTPEQVSIESAIAERSSMLFLGTIITGGRTVAMVVKTGERTELGRIGRLVTDVGYELTPLQKKLDALGRQLAHLVLIIAAIVAIAGWLRGDELWMMVEVGISLAVAAVPEALPAVTTFILAFGVVRMARRHAIVRRLSAVETLGSTTVICSDKTGTLTMNRMTVTDIRAFGEMQSLMRAMVLCNDATPQSGDPTEIALIDAAVQSGIDPDPLRTSHPRTAEFPFEPATKRMITIHRTEHGGFLWAMKGAPNVVLGACAGLTAERRLELETVNREMAAGGLRVLAAAEKTTAGQESKEDEGYTFLGFVGMLDPPRPGVVEAVATARRAGIRLIMLTGDQVDTARSIARQLHLSESEPRVAHARDLEGADALRLVESTDVFARVSPEDKYRIVEALQSNGEIVAVTGDGVNDAPALKKADVGIAMGERGTEVAKEAADIVLADDDFSTIVTAIEGGRTIYANIIKFVHMLFSHNLAEVLTVFIAILLGWPVPLLPLQILWMNLVTDVFPAFALALEPAAPRVMEQPPRSPHEVLLSRGFLGLIAWQAAMLSAIALCAYAWALRDGGEAQARTVALLALVGVEIGHTFNCRSRTRSAFAGILSNPHIWFASGTVIGLQMLAFWFEPLRRVLRLEQPAGKHWIVFALSVVLPIVIVELQKAIVTAKDSAHHAARRRR